MEWIVKRDLDDLPYMNQFHIHSLLAKVLSYHEYDEQEVEAFFNQRLIYHDFSLFSEGEMAVERIQEAIENNEKICIYGDYDCDGILATAILVEAFKQLNKEVGFHIPNRMSDGYGLTVERVEQIANKGYTLIITVDNGIKAFDAINKANELGVDVIVTDHHDFDESELVEACAIVHTKLSPEYPFKEISGGVVAYKLAAALLQKHDKYLYCLAAITTISDMMPLLDENRSMVKRALTFMKEEKFQSIELLLGINQTYSSQSIGFVIAPKINSFGRLPEIIHPNHVVKFFLKDCPLEFRKQFASQAEKINQKRQSLMKEQYQEVMSHTNLKNKFLFSYQTKIHEGMIGLVAGKYTREYYRPSFVMSYDSQSDCYKGSARGVDYLPLDKLFSSLKDSFEQYGGHALAGGFSLKKEKIPELKEKIAYYIEKRYDTLPEKKLTGILIEKQDITKENILELELLQPFGNGNEEILFCLENIKIDKITTMSEGKHLKLFFDLGHTMMQGVYFNHGNEFEMLQSKGIVSVIGKISLNRFRNIETITMMIEDLK